MQVFFQEKNGKYSIVIKELSKKEAQDILKYILENRNEIENEKIENRKKIENEEIESKDINFRNLIKELDKFSISPSDIIKVKLDRNSLEDIDIILETPYDKTIINIKYIPEKYKDLILDDLELFYNYDKQTKDNIIISLLDIINSLEYSDSISYIASGIETTLDMLSEDNVVCITKNGIKDYIKHVCKIYDIEYDESKIENSVKEFLEMIKDEEEAYGLNYGFSSMIIYHPNQKLYCLNKNFVVKYFFFED